MSRKRFSHEYRTKFYITRCEIKIFTPVFLDILSKYLLLFFWTYFQNIYSCFSGHTFKIFTPVFLDILSKYLLLFFWTYFQNIYSTISKVSWGTTGKTGGSSVVRSRTSGVCATSHGQLRNENVNDEESRRVVYKLWLHQSILQKHMLEATETGVQLKKKALKWSGHMRLTSWPVLRLGRSIVAKASFRSLRCCYLILNPYRYRHLWSLKGQSANDTLKYPLPYNLRHITFCL